MIPDIRPKRDWVYVLAEPRPEKVGSLFLPGNETGAERVMEGAGVLLSVGPGEKGEKLQLCAGQRVLFRGFLKVVHRIENDEVWEDGTKKWCFLMAIDDVLAVIPQGLAVGIYGGRPEVKEIR